MLTIWFSWQDLENSPLLHIRLASATLKVRFLFGLGHNQLKELPWWLSGKESVCNAEDIGDAGSISGSGRSDPRICPPSPSPPCHFSQGRRVRSVSGECYLGPPRRHSPAPARFSTLPVRSFSAWKSHSVTNFSCLWTLQRSEHLKLVQKKVL